MREDFAAFILSNSRPNRVLTYSTLKRQGYTGRIILLIDDLDPSCEEYKNRYGDEVFVFNKKEIAKTFDQADNFDNMQTIVYARNATFEVAEKLGIKYFIQLDDDYSQFSFRFTDKLIGCYKAFGKIGLDNAFSYLLDFFIQTPIHSLCILQSGDFINGEQSTVTAKRKAMNSFICSTDRKFQFLGRINEDVNTYTSGGARGLLFLSTNQLSLTQAPTQHNSGGMTGVYLDCGTYIKSFYSVMFHPSAVKIAPMGCKHKRIHHKINWSKTTPMIIREGLKKTL